MDGWTALHYASLDGYPEIGEILIKNGADINLQTDFGRTALHTSAQQGHEQFVKILLNS